MFLSQANRLLKAIKAARLEPRNYAQSFADFTIRHGVLHYSVFTSAEFTPYTDRAKCRMFLLQLLAHRQGLQHPGLRQNSKRSMKSRPSRPSGQNAIAPRRRRKQGQRAAKLVATNRRTQAGMVRSSAMKNAFEKSGKNRDQRLQEALQLQKELRQLTHQALLAREEDRKKISCGLQDEIAQALLGINIHLLALQKEGRCNAKDFKNEIAKAQRLVLKSAQSVRRFALELDTDSRSSEAGRSRLSKTVSRRAPRRRGHG